MKLPLATLQAVAEQGSVLKRMAANEIRVVTVDYIPGRDPMVVPRETGDDEPLEPLLPSVITITFRLEDAMFGGVIYVALTCANLVLLHPFVWQGYDHLANVSFP